jgi:cytochrome c-type biogenesis protein CcmH/NrfG
MSPLSWLVALFLGLMALVFVLYPLYQRRPVELPQTTSETLTAQAENEQTARSALREFELDFQLGNLAESDYSSLRERYLRRAYLAHKSRQEREQAIDALIEERLQRLREEEHAENHHATETQDDHAED